MKTIYWTSLYSQDSILNIFTKFNSVSLNSWANGEFTDSKEGISQENFICIEKSRYKLNSSFQVEQFFRASLISMTILCER